MRPCMPETIAMTQPQRAHAPSPLLVALCAWLLPGGGYFLLGQKARGWTICISIIALFLMGILIGGIRIMDPPGWGQYGYMTQIIERRTRGSEYEEQRYEPAAPAQPGDAVSDALFQEPIAELGAKPWFVGQILCGPITLAAAAVSVHEAHPTGAGVNTNPPTEGVPTSHARSWEIGALYTAVAGMLNLLAIIDSTFRAAAAGEAR